MIQPARTPTTRMFIDEVGHADMRAAGDENQRYLSLTGVIIQMDHYRAIVEPSLHTLKLSTFGSTEVILHRTDIMNCRGSFACLLDEATRNNFDAEVLSLLETLQYSVLTVTIDKLEHSRKYRVWRHHPYHYCLECLLERYVFWLEKNGTYGDVMAEARGKREDKALKSAYAHYFRNGTRFMTKQQIQLRCTSSEVKFASKDKNVSGLQLADLVAHPSFKYAQSKRSEPGKPLPNFGALIVEILRREKYDRNEQGNHAFALKWLP